MGIPTSTIEEISAKLRSIRLSKSLSLSDVESLSQGSLKAVVLGSYERGARTLSVKRVIEIAAIYQIPLSQLFTDGEPIEVINPGRAIFDLRAINRRALDVSHTENQRYVLLARVAQRIVKSRQDWNGEVLSIREVDIETIATVLDLTISKTLAWLESENILLSMRNR
jgi:transcriptional regulator with XRE-family HTH domain